MKMEATFLLVFVMSMSYISVSGSDLFFPTSYVKTPVLQINASVLYARAIPFSDVLYTMVIPEKMIGWFHLNSSSGELQLTKQVTGDDVHFMIRAETPFTLSTVDMSIDFMPNNGTLKTCRELVTEDVCFWKSAEYSIYENRNETLLGELGPHFNCPYTKPVYKLANGTQFLRINGTQLFSHSLLDRDFGEPGAFINVSVACYWDFHLVSKTVNVVILDENDNPPLAHGNVTLHQDVYLSGSQLIEGDVVATATMSDADHRSTSEYDWYLEGDFLNLLYVNCTTRPSFDVAKLGTSIFCRLRARKTMLFDRDGYVVRLIVNDTTMVPGLGNSHMDIFFNLAKSLGQKTVLRPYTVETATDYPKEVEVYRGATLYARIAQPSWKTTVVGNPERAAQEPSYFLVLPPPELSPFKITKQGGIIYVSNITSLLHFPSLFSLIVEVNFPEGRATNVTLGVTLVDSDIDGPCNNPSQWMSVTATHWDHCSEALSYKKCMSMCAVGTGGSSSPSVFRRLGNGCVWRGARKPSNEYTTNYSTCTPDIATCPDSVCDPLENTYKLICPQDCSTSVYFTIGSKHRGLSGGRGICSCDEHTKCVCLSGNISTQLTTTTPVYQNISETAVTDEADHEVFCGRICTISLALLFLCFILIIMSCICCFFIRKKNVIPEACLERPLSLEIPLNYVDGNDNPEIEEGDNVEQQNIGAPSTLSTITGRTRSLDPKWEFSRRDLFIFEGKIGEGEFGVVQKAQAFNIMGIPGFSIVAVKTVKQHSSTQELQDLISEFELLKEVSHINIIRLLGVCTVPGDEPMYLIMEFAEYGSLRSYLRKFRNLGSLDHLPVRNTSTEQKDETITSRDVLKFGWQITKGMIYLSQMKLVHRDLAARNVLLASERICKISDFGLTRDVYMDETYRKKSNGRVPVKWMAIESLIDHIYTTKSDVWSFGILLWELVTLGCNPYPGTDVNDLYNRLDIGYRMEQPSTCSMELYSIMKQCWERDPNERPTFEELEDDLNKMVTDDVEYLDIRPLMFDNRQYFNGEEQMHNRREDVAQYSSGDHTSASTAPLLKATIGQSEPFFKNFLPKDEQHFLSPQPSTSLSSSSSSSSSGEYCHSCKTETNIDIGEDGDGYMVPKPTASLHYMVMNGHTNKRQSIFTVSLDSIKTLKAKNKTIVADKIIHEKKLTQSL